MAVPWPHDARLQAPKATVQPLLIDNTADNSGITYAQPTEDWHAIIKAFQPNCRWPCRVQGKALSISCKMP